MKTVVSPTQLHFHDLVGHFLAMGANDRFLRFGGVMSDAWIVAYVESLFASAEPVLVVVEPGGDISGALHLESTDSGVVLGLSVSSWARRLGIGTLLMQRAELLARTRGLKTLFVRNLNLNAALQQLALHLAMSVAHAPTALSTNLAVPAARGRDAWQVESTPKIRLADDSLRSHWKGAPPEASLRDLTEPIAS
jgi:GNAT superfamily N-acetyltransferase